MRLTRQGRINMGRNSKRGNDMVEIKYVDGSEETIKTVQNEFRGNKHFLYDKDLEMFVVLDCKKLEDCMMIPREFVKSIRHIEV